MNVPARIFLVDDDALILSMLTRVLREEGYDVRAEADAQNVAEKIKAWGPAVVMLDIRLPGRSGIEILDELSRKGVAAPVVMLTADDTAETAVKAMKLGAADYLTKPFNIDEVKIILKGIIERERLQQEVDYLRKVNEELIEKDIVGVSPAIADLKQRIERMAEASVPTVLITGESGTGKEIMARWLHHRMHDHSPRQAPFIRVNCAAIPETLLESELFGHEKGAFTDAKSDKKGLFEMAQGGSILLDEIGDMKPNLQSKLLRVLEDRMIRRIGGSVEIPVDVTVITTTNKQLADMVDRGDFRMDLFYRLNAFSLHIPPLRERPEDIPVLADHYCSFFALKYNKKTPKGFSSEARKAMNEHRWPGNVRELKNVVERLVVLESSDMILPGHLPREITAAEREQSAPASADGGGFVLPPSGISLDDVERDLIRQALERANNNKSQAAKLLRITYDTLRYQVKKFGLE